MSEFIPTEEQQVALSEPAPLLILAGAGTGKTTVLSHRIARLIVEGKARPDEILALTFAEKAAAEMAERLSRLLEELGFGEAGREVHCSTFHSFGLQIIQENALMLGQDPDARVLSAPACWQILSAVIDDLDLEAIDLTNGRLSSTFGKLLSFISSAKDHMVGPEELEDYLSSLSTEGLSDITAKYLNGRLAGLRDVLAVYRRYEEAKGQKAYLDYGDLIALPIRLLRAHPDLRERYRQRYRYLFIDEYQDTNHAQRLLLLELIPPQAHVVVIGDDDQSIYGWRGAVIQNILRFPDEAPIREVGARRSFLTINRRSGPPILEIANTAISRLEERYRKTLRYMDGAAPAVVGHYVAASDEAEGRWIAAMIQQLHSRSEMRDPTGKKRGYGLFAVLCRKRSLFEPVAKALDHAGIPYELIGGTGFYGRWEIRNILSYLRVLADPGDNIALARVLKLPPWRISDRDLFHLSRWARSQAAAHSSEKDTAADPPPIPSTQRQPPKTRQDDALRYRLYDALAHADSVPGLSMEARQRASRLLRTMDSLHRAASQITLSNLVERVIEASGHRLEMSSRGDFGAKLALLNLEKLVEMARQMEVEEGTLEGFVEYARYALESGDEESEVRPVDEGSDTVKVMTIHQAKGLEFPVVFIPGLAEKIFPDTRIDDPDRWDQLPEELRGDRGRYPILDLQAIRTLEELNSTLKQRKQLFQKMRLDEERRLFYVAITRAQRALFFSRGHWYSTNIRPKSASTFWDEIIDTGLSVSQGEEEAPSSNPRLSAAPERAESEAQPVSLARLLLRPDRGAGFIDRVALEMPEVWSRLKAEVDEQITALATGIAPSWREMPVEVSCTGLVRYDQCPRLYRYLHLDRLPEKPSLWAGRGAEVHRRIEEESLSGGHGVAAEEAELEPRDWDSQADGETVSSVEEMVETYRRSVFGRRPPTMVEEPFALPVNGSLVRGRIDRLDRLPDGSWELVDYKAASFSGQVGRGRILQLRLYALAAWRLWSIEPEKLSCFLFFLADGHIETICPSSDDLARTEEWVAETLRRIQAGRFPRTEDASTCLRCGYSQVCEARDGP